MARYIDAHRVENLLTMCGNYHGVIWLESVKSIIHDVSTENVIKVVRCKDCKYVSHEPCKDFKNVWICNRTPFSRMNGGNMPNDFCSYGEAKDG